MISLSGGSIVWALSFMTSEHNHTCETFSKCSRNFCHYNLCDEEGNHKCDICGKSFPSELRLKIHEKVHDKNNF